MNSMNLRFCRGRFYTVAAGLAAAGVAAPRSAAAAPDDPTTIESAMAQDWMQVPGAVVHPNCVHPLPDGAAVRDTGDVTVNGKLIAHFDACPHRSFSTIHHGASAQHDDVVSRPPLLGSQGYAAEIYGEVPQSLNTFGNRLQVPAAPNNPTDNQLVYLWSGVDNFYGTMIAQSVIQFGSATPGRSAGQGVTGRWTAAAWIGISGNYYPSSSIPVSTNDVLTSTETGGPGYGWWTAYVWDTTTSNGTSETMFTNNNPNVAFGAVLETVISRCSDLPSTGYGLFTIPALSLNSTPVTGVAWTPGSNYSGPNCSYGENPNYGFGVLELTWATR